MNSPAARRRSAALTLLALLLAVPALAAIKAMTLEELVALNTDAVHGRIAGSDTFHAPNPQTGEDAVWTRLSLVGESVGTGQPALLDLVFLGSHDPRDGYAVSEMPTLQDSRVGNEVVIFWHEHVNGTHAPGGADADKVVHSLAEVYRVERGFGQPVVIGKGRGAALPDNVRLPEALARVRMALAERPVTPAPGAVGDPR